MTKSQGQKKWIEMTLGTAVLWDARSIAKMDHSAGQKNKLNSSCASCSDVS